MSLFDYNSFIKFLKENQIIATVIATIISTYITNLSITFTNDILLPSISINSSYVFAKENTYLVYPNNYNYYVNFFRDTYQHGGISLEEIIIPYVVLMPKIKK